MTFTPPFGSFRSLKRFSSRTSCLVFLPASRMPSSSFQDGASLWLVFPMWCNVLLLSFNTGQWFVLSSCNMSFKCSIVRCSAIDGAQGAFGIFFLPLLGSNWLAVFKLMALFAISVGCLIRFHRPIFARGPFQIKALDKLKGKRQKGEMLEIGQNHTLREEGLKGLRIPHKRRFLKVMGTHSTYLYSEDWGWCT